MATIRPDVFLTRGDTNSITVTFEGVDLTGATVFFTAKPTVSDLVDDSDAVMDVDVSSFDNPTSGVAVIPLSSNVTNVAPGDYFYDVQAKLSDGTILSIPARKLRVSGDVTRRTT